MKEFDNVILGAGLGGLSVAACLARLGRNVVVLEQHSIPGGCCHTFDRGEYSFCADVHYISQCRPGQTIAVLLDFIGKEVPFKTLDVDCIDRVVTPDVDFRIPLGWENLRSRLHGVFPDESNAIDVYCDEISRLHRQMVHLAREVRWYERKFSDWVKLPKYSDLFSRRNWTLQDLYDKARLSKKLQDLLAGQSGDYALPPNQISLLTHASLVSNYAEGAFYPEYHFRHLVDSIVESISDRGGKVRLATPVEHIEIRGGQVLNVRAGGETYVAREAYISDMDPKKTVALMHESAAELGRREFRRITNYKYSASAFNIYLGLNDRFKPERYNLGAWNIWYYPRGDLNDAYRRQAQGDLDRPWVFLSCPTLKSERPGMAPPGHHVLEIATVCSYESFSSLREPDSKAYSAKKREVYERVMSSVRDLLPDIDDCVAMGISGTPITTERFLGQPKGNVYGAKLIPQQVAFNRLGYRTKISNLLLVGATAGYPSVPGVINNGIDVAQLITGEPIR